MFSDRTIQRLRHIQHLLDTLKPQAKPQVCTVPGSPAPQGDIIVFPGSFNPPTNAHLAMLKQARQFGRAHGEKMRVYAAMSKRTTGKETVERPLLVDRVLLLDTMIHNHVRHTGILLFNRGLYVEQAEAIRKRFHRVKRLYFLLGFDKIVQIFDAHYYENRNKALRELFALAEILVAPRAGAGAAELAALLALPENARFAKHVHLLPLKASFRDVSSSRIRQGLAAHEQDMPPEARRFVRDTQAYTSPVQLADGSTMDVYGERAKAIEKVIHANAGKLACSGRSARYRHQ
jgi:nicotinamide-nucleotide adenylyltransferase